MTSQLHSIHFNATILQTSVSYLNIKYFKPILWITSGGLVLYFISKFFRKKKINYLDCEKWPTSSHIKKRRTQSEDCVSDAYNWPDVIVPKTSDLDLHPTGGATLVDGTPITPHQLGQMGLEALETVVSYWEEALSFSSDLHKTEEFINPLRELLEHANTLQGKAEHLFIHQHSILHAEETQSFALSTHTANQLLSVSTVESSSFVSAQDTIADLRDFEDLLSDEPNNSVDGSNHPLYLEALEVLNTKSIPYRYIRSNVVGVETQQEYLAKLHCLRLSFQHLMAQDDIKSWWIDKGRDILVGIISKFNRDPKDLVIHYNQIVEYLSVESNMAIMMEELEARNVKCLNFYDIVLDYILVDFLSDLDLINNFPSSVIGIMQNRWLSNGFKESALSTAIWSLFKTKKSRLKYPNGFKAQFYQILEIITPLFAWAFLGPDEELNSLMRYFKDSSLEFIRDLYDFNKVSYENVETMSEDIMNLARKNFDAVSERIEKTY